MPRRRRLIAASALALAAALGLAAATAQAPRIGRPRPAPDTPSSMPPLPPAVIDDALAVEGEELKAKRVSTRLGVDVRVNGRGPYRFLVDSGADTSVVGLRVAEQLQLPLGTPVILNNMTARNIVDRVRVDALTLGSSTVRNLHLPALSEADLGGEGLIGIDALVGQRLLMDFEKQLIKVEDARVPVRALPGEIVVIARRKRGQLILTQVSAAGFPLDAVIDTGTEISIGNMALRDKLIGSRREKVWTVMATGVTGVKVNLELARIRELKLGSVTLRDVPMAFADLPPFKVFGLADEPALLLGTDVLEAFSKVSLDFRSRKVRFQLKRCRSTIMLHTSPTPSRTRLSADGGPQVCRR